MTELRRRVAMPSELGFLAITLRAFVDEGAFVSECIELQTASMGDSLDDALENAYDAARVYVACTSEHGELERVLAECGIRVTETPPVSEP